VCLPREFVETEIPVRLRPSLHDAASLRAGFRPAKKSAGPQDDKQMRVGLLFLLTTELIVVFQESV